MQRFDHPIFLQSVRFINEQLGCTGLEALEQQVLERLIHSSGDFSIQSFLRFSPQACEKGILALLEGASIITDTAMAAEAIKPMARRTLNTSVRSCLDWAPIDVEFNSTRTALGILKFWEEVQKNLNHRVAPIVVIGSAPTALEALLEVIGEGGVQPSLIIGMPVGFIGVDESKKRLAESHLHQIRLDGSRGGAGLASATINALLRAAFMRLH